MKVSELIEKLKECDQDARVIVEGYEYGYEDIEQPLRLEITLNQNNFDFAGPHEAARNITGELDTFPDETAILIRPAP